MTMWWIATAATGGLVGFTAGWLAHHRLVRYPWGKRKDSNENAIEEAKLLYRHGLIDETELETRVGHLHDWDGRP